MSDQFSVGQRVELLCCDHLANKSIWRRGTIIEMWHAREGRPLYEVGSAAWLVLKIEFDESQATSRTTVWVPGRDPRKLKRIDGIVDRLADLDRRDKHSLEEP